MQKGLGPEPSRYHDAPSANGMPRHTGTTERSGGGRAEGPRCRTATDADQAARASYVSDEQQNLERIFGGIAHRRDTRIEIFSGRTIGNRSLTPVDCRHS